ncbi:uncharacterized protein K489DRAFT_170983 [Dissoconium aciculare CBS 342.82]|uniref:Uncharacterized protein n=1 Tax=Dissoconium aciculare CBS 342.82 TaxID=1314786 RepID=A0A6J3M7N0_9PEZI|nr:uncharacterized protein K489DRAFT_170983 [Dissoconium aciculare CBS 342.82]KAF1824010.1 hypothetical protein K489DRAFT_170983 [Dissoconium aciculare CBS 342.82]
MCTKQAVTTVIPYSFVVISNYCPTFAASSHFYFRLDMVGGFSGGPSCHGSNHYLEVEPDSGTTSKLTALKQLNFRAMRSENVDNVVD